MTNFTDTGRRAEINSSPQAPLKKPNLSSWRVINFKNVLGNSSIKFDVCYCFKVYPIHFPHTGILIGFIASGLLPQLLSKAIPE